jgi:hypothetical protein
MLITAALLPSSGLGWPPPTAPSHGEYTDAASGGDTKHTVVTVGAP